MTTTNKLPVQFSTAVLIKRMLIGACIGLVLMGIFLSGNYTARPEWGQYWMIRPFVIIALGGAGGAACFYFLYLLFGFEGGWKKTAAITVGVMGFIIALYLSFVLGLAGTMWH